MIGWWKYMYIYSITCVETHMSKISDRCTIVSQDQLLTLLSRKRFALVLLVSLNDGGMYLPTTFVH